MKRTAAAVITAAGLAASASSLPLDQVPQAPTFRSRVDLVQVDVVVVDEDGAPVTTGLRAADFALRDRGRLHAEGGWVLGVGVRACDLRWLGCQ
jgi:hypothetical protein